MTTKKRLSVDNPVVSLLTPMFGPKRARVMAAFLRREYRIETVRHLKGVVEARVPYMSKRVARKRGVSLRSLSSRQKNNEKVMANRLHRALHLPYRDSMKIVRACKRIPGSFTSYHFGFSWALGAVRNSALRINRFWINAARISIAKGFFVVPGYKDTGEVFDQGDRGTCVANAACSLLDYKSNQQWSRQFLYHQCKWRDGIPHEEGTFIETAMEIMSDENLVDYGNVKEAIWPYNPCENGSTHQGPPPEKAFDCTRVVSASPVFIRPGSKVADIKYLLNLNSGGKGNPVEVGLELRESFFSHSTNETGWVTMPLPGEEIVGYHAMLVVGYDDDRQLFLVRNSWGPQWAPRNDKGYAGHAWIPYKYIEKYCFVGVTLISLEFGNVFVPEYDRLYNNEVAEVYSSRVAAAAYRRGTGQYAYRSRRSVSFFGLLFRMGVTLAILFLFWEPVTSLMSKASSYLGITLDFAKIEEAFSAFLHKLIN